MKAFTLLEAMLVIAGIGVVVFLIATDARKPVTKGGDLREKTYEAVVDGCQYIVIQGGAGNSKYFSMTHKGNCTNH